MPEHFDFPPVVHDWVQKGLGMSSRVCVTGHIKDPVPLIEKSRASCPGGRCPPSFIALKVTLPSGCTGCKTSTQTLNSTSNKGYNGGPIFAPQPLAAADMCVAAGLSLSQNKLSVCRYLPSNLLYIIRLTRLTAPPPTPNSISADEGSSLWIRRFVECMLVLHHSW